MSEAVNITGPAIGDRHKRWRGAGSPHKPHTDLASHEASWIKWPAK